MRYNQLVRRFRWVGMCCSIFMVGFYAGRISVRHWWLEFVSGAVYLVAVASYAIPLFWEAKRERDEFHALIQEIEEKRVRATEDEDA